MLEFFFTFDEVCSHFSDHLLLKFIVQEPQSLRTEYFLEELLCNSFLRYFYKYFKLLLLGKELDVYLGFGS